MFYEGDLQSGISLAVTEAKHVICFVRDDSDESATWEKDYLVDEEISSLVKEKAVSLRLQEGSVEAGYLASFCPISKVPTLVVIKNGVLQEYIVSGVAEEEFKRRLKKALEDQPPPAPAPPPAQMASNTSTTENTPTSSAAVSTHTPDHDSRAAEESKTAEQSRRENIRAGKRRAEATEGPEQAPQTPESESRKHRLEQRKREQQKKEERERILNQIKLDNENRKAREEARKASLTPSKNETNSPKPTAKPAPNQYRLQIRLFDGSSVRSSFSPTQTIQKDVRPWLDSQRSDGDAPYNLKQILTPLPSRTISVAEEDQTLEELGLGPTANLVMVPVRTYTEAYASSGASLPVRGLYAGYNLITGTVGAVAGVVGSFLGISGGASAGATPAATEPPSTTETPSTGSLRGGRNGRSNVRTLYDEDDRESRQFYNGNQLNFEPRKDEDQN